MSFTIVAAICEGHSNCVPLFPEECIHQIRTAEGRQITSLTIPSAQTVAHANSHVPSKMQFLMYGALNSRLLPPSILSHWS
jgi:hypothetical protein